MKVREHCYPSLGGETHYAVHPLPVHIGRFLLIDRTPVDRHPVRAEATLGHPVEVGFRHRHLGHHSEKRVGCRFCPFCPGRAEPDEQGARRDQGCKSDLHSPFNTRHVKSCLRDRSIDSAQFAMVPGHRVYRYEFQYHSF